MFPGNLLPSTYLNPDDKQEIRARSEIERRGVYIDLLESEIGAKLSSLVELVKQCLLNDPLERPSTEELLTKLQEVRVKVEGEYGGGVVRLDLARVRLAKEIKEKDRTIKEKDRRIEELTQQQVQ